MSKEELIKTVRDEVVRNPKLRVEQGIWTTNEFNYAIVSAYNKAIDDAIKLKQEDYPHDKSSYSVDIVVLEQLKIMD
jgi:hypothetical protein